MSLLDADIVPPPTEVCSFSPVAAENRVDPLQSDELISRAGLASIRRYVPIVINGLKMTVQCGHVTLQGRVNLAFLSTRAEKVVRELAGVTGVTNQIVVTPLPTTRPAMKP